MPINFSALDNQWRWRPSASGTGCRTKYFAEAAGANFRYGEPVGIVVVAKTDMVTQLAPLPESNESYTTMPDDAILLGWSLANPTGVVGSPIPVLLAKDVEVLVRSVDSTLKFDKGDVVRLVRYRGLGDHDLFATLAPAEASGPLGYVVVERYAPPLVSEDDIPSNLYWIRPRDVFTVQGQ